MFYVYVLRSKKDNELYIGRTKDLKRRFHEHNSGQTRSTRNRVPFELVYYEAYKNKTDTIIREKRLKQFKNGYKELKKRIEFSLA